MKKYICFLVTFVTYALLACHYCSCYPYCTHNHTNVKIYQKRIKSKCHNCNGTFWQYLTHVYCIDKCRYVLVEKPSLYCSKCSN